MKIANMSTKNGIDEMSLGADLGNSTPGQEIGPNHYYAEYDNELSDDTLHPVMNGEKTSIVGVCSPLTIHDRNYHSLRCRR
jgi:hypothetical protein